MYEFRSLLFKGSVLLQEIADDVRTPGGGLTRISWTQNMRHAELIKVQQALLIWDVASLPRFGADGVFGAETAAAVHRFKREELSVPEQEIIDDVGPRTVQRLDKIAVAADSLGEPTGPNAKPAGLFGKYRGLVADNDDPQHMGRIEVEVQAAGDAIKKWAMPCVPYAGPDVGLFALPPIGASIWVEFEAGDAELPVWTGCFWESGQLPMLPNPQQKFIKTDQVTLLIDDDPMAATLSITAGVGGQVRLLLGETDTVQLSNGQAGVLMKARAVSVNGIALVIT